MNSSGIAKNKYGKYILILFPIVFIAVCAVLFWKCGYGFPYEESFYVNTAMRFVRGDLPIIHEWHISQLSFIYLEPFVYAFVKLTGSTEGIMLFMRYVYTAVWALFALFVFIRLRGRSLIAAVSVSLILLVYTPAGQMALYYNSIGIITLLSSCLIIATAEKYKPCQYIIAGVLYAVAVTCCPFLAILWVIFCFAGIRGLIKRSSAGRIWLFTTLGILGLFVVFCIAFFSRASLGEYLDIIPRMFNDSEHQWNILIKTAEYLGSMFTVTIPCGIILVLMAVNLLYFYLRKDKADLMTGFMIACILTIALQISFVLCDNLINYLIFPPAFLGLYCFVCLRDEFNGRLFFYVWIPGIVYSFCLNLSSNMQFVSISAASSVASSASIVMAVRCAASFKGKMIPWLLALLISVQFLTIAERRIVYVFGAQDIRYTTEKLDSGIAKGMYETPEWRDIYYSKLSELAPVKEDGSVKTLLIVSTEWWMYLESEKDVASYTTWTPNLTPGMLDDYYTLYPDKRPDAIYVDQIYSDLVPHFAMQGYKGTMNEYGGYILYPEA